MANEWTLGFRCARVGRAVEAPGGDDVVLLRAARTLKGLHGQLTTAVYEQHRARMRAECDLHQAMTSLDAMEQELRDILLQYSGIGGQDLHTRVRRAFSHCLDVVVLLESPESIAVPAPVRAQAIENSHVVLR